jgi:hypothetical protein
MKNSNSKLIYCLTKILLEGIFTVIRGTSIVKIKDLLGVIQKYSKVDVPL